MKCKVYTAATRKTEVKMKEIDYSFQNALDLRDTKNKSDVEK